MGNLLHKPRSQRAIKLKTFDINGCKCLRVSQAFATIAKAMRVSSKDRNERTEIFTENISPELVCKQPRKRAVEHKRENASSLLL